MFKVGLKVVSSSVVENRLFNIETGSVSASDGTLGVSVVVVVVVVVVFVVVVVVAVVVVVVVVDLAAGRAALPHLALLQGQHLPVRRLTHFLFLKW